MSTDHRHDGFDVSGYADPDQLPVDGQLLGQFIGAAFDGCTSCQDAQLTLLIEDPTTTGRLVELACVATHALLGGLPLALTEPDKPGPASEEFRRLAAAGLDGHRAALFATAATMSPAERRAAANTAADILIGQLMTSPDG